MRFLNRYDLQEPITAGPLKVYEALEPDTGVRRLIQILEWKEVPAEVSTLQVLEQFRQTAPDPPGIILDAGRIEKTNQIYLVTSFPADPSSVQRWVNSYLAKSGAVATEPMPVVPLQAAIRPAAPTTSPARNSAEREQPWTRHEPGAFTKEFLAALDGSYKIASAPPPVPPTAETTTEPGAFTKEFLSLSHSTSAAQEHKQDKDSVAPRTGTSGLFEDVNPGPATSASVPPIPEPIIDNKTGEFTSFFRGYSEPPSERPASSFPSADVLGNRDRQPEGGQGSPGEFTKMFQADFAAPPDIQEGPSTSTFDRDPGKSPQPARFTPDPGPPRPAPLRDSSTFRESATPSLDSQASAASFEPAWQGTTTPPRSVSLGTQLPRPPVESQPMPGSSLEPAWKEDKSGATQFITPAAAQQPPPEPVSRGPSEFTMVISATSVPGGSPRPPSPSPAPAPPTQVPSVPVQLPSMTAPPVPVYAPAAPPAPPAPNLAAMHAPPPAAPAPQLAPQPAPKLVSYLPLIITLNVLLLVAIGIILYFALKSHH
jgi:hypothetical protein